MACLLHMSGRAIFGRLYKPPPSPAARAQRDALRRTRQIGPIQQPSPSRIPFSFSSPSCSKNGCRTVERRWRYQGGRLLPGVWQGHRPGAFRRLSLSSARTFVPSLPARRPLSAGQARHGVRWLWVSARGVACSAGASRPSQACRSGLKTRAAYRRAHSRRATMASTSQIGRSLLFSAT